MWDVYKTVGTIVPDLANRNASNNDHTFVSIQDEIELLQEVNT